MDGGNGEFRDNTRTEWDLGITMDDGVVLRADIVDPKRIAVRRLSSRGLGQGRRR